MSSLELSDVHETVRGELSRESNGAERSRGVTDRLQVGLRRAARVPAKAKVGLGSILVLALLALFLPIVLGLNPYQMHPVAVLRGPSLQFPLGTDDYGRSLLARVMFGMQTSFEIGAAVFVATGILGLAGAIAVARLPRFGSVAMRGVDALMALPAVVIALALVTVIGPGFGEVILVEVLFFLPWSIRVMRASILAVEHSVFVEAAASQGARGAWVMRKHILPNAAAPMLVQQVLIFGYALLAEAVLSFLGVGIEAPAASLGNLLTEAQPVMLQDPWFSIVPGIAIAITVLAVNLCADGIAEAMKINRQTLA